jgi:DNA-binding helix-hairpin-helix protein with protein kinase domain
MAVAEVGREELLGSGGEADVFRVPGQPHLAEKRWRSPSFQQARKLELMLAHPPEGAVTDGHVNLAWPVEAVRSAGGEVVGFRMPAVDLDAAVPLFCAYNPHARRDETAGITWRHLVRGGRNLAAVVAALHRSGYVVGDLNESNVLIDRRALVTILDCDSIQVPDPTTGEVHHCGVARPDFLAPELAGRDLAATDRKEGADRFALAVMVFLLLQEGVHPYAGVWRGRGDPPDVTTRMRGRRFPYLLGTRMRPPPRALRMRGLGGRLRLMFYAAFVLGPWFGPARPSALSWERALGRLENRLTECGRSRLHVRPGRRRCPWCRRTDAGLPDAWPDVSGKGIRPRPPSLPRRLAMKFRRAIRVAAHAQGTWAMTRTKGLRAALPACAALVAAVLVIPAVTLPLLAALTLVARLRLGSLRLTARRTRRLGRRLRLAVPPALWWALVVVLVLAELLAPPPF